MRRLGAIFAGGTARRFGADKALAMLGDRTLLDHVIAILSPHVDALAICGRAHGDWPAIADRPAPGLGPLGALNGALRHASDAGYDEVLTMACDTPVIPAALFAMLAAAEPPCALASLPVMGRWRTADADALDAFLAESADRSMRAWIDRAGVTMLASPPIANINRPADLDPLAAAALRHGPSGAG